MAGRRPANGPRRRVPPRPAATRRQRCARGGRLGGLVVPRRRAPTRSMGRGHRRRRAFPPRDRRAPSTGVHRRADRPVGDRRSRRVGRGAARALPAHRSGRPTRRRPGAADRANQLIHGDLTGNILFDDALAPAVIDVSLCWRPPAFASAIVVADALVWEGADETLLAAVAHLDRFEQFLARALIYRIVAAVEGGFEATDDELDDRYRPAVDLAVTLTDRHAHRHDRG